MEKKVLAIIPTYNPQITLYNNLEIILPQVDEIIIIDDGSIERNTLRLIEEKSLCKIINLDKNLGIATALNHGIYYAINNNYKFVIMFDQDSVPNPNLVEFLLMYCNKWNDSGKLGLIGANYNHYNNTKYQILSNGLSEVKAVITSGSLLPLTVVEKAGYFKEDYFIDEVDHEYCLRLRSLGYKIYRTKESLMTHTIGIPVKIKLFGEEYLLPYNHNHERRYYQFRNSIMLIKQYWKKEYYFICRTCIRLLINFLICFLFEKNKIKKINFMLKGFVDGIKGEMGKLNCSI